MCLQVSRLVLDSGRCVCGRGDDGIRDYGAVLTVVLGLNLGMEGWRGEASGSSRGPMF